MQNQLQPLQEAAGGLVGRSWHRWHQGGCDKRPGLDALLKGVARRVFDVVAAWSVCRLGRSLSDLIGLLGELQSRDIDLSPRSARSGACRRPRQVCTLDGIEGTPPREVGFANGEASPAMACSSLRPHLVASRTQGTSQTCGRG